MPVQLCFLILRTCKRNAMNFGLERRVREVQVVCNANVFTVESHYVDDLDMMIKEEHSKQIHKTSRPSWEWPHKDDKIRHFQQHKTLPGFLTWFFMHLFYQEQFKIDLNITLYYGLLFNWIWTMTLSLSKIKSFS